MVNPSVAVSVPRSGFLNHLSFAADSPPLSSQVAASLVLSFIASNALFATAGVESFPRARAIAFKR